MFGDEHISKEFSDLGHVGKLKQLVFQQIFTYLTIENAILIQITEIYAIHIINIKSIFY